MSDIDDDGKIWLQGNVKPEYGVRIGESYFILGKGDDDNINCFIHDNYLLVDLHDPMKQHRIFRRFDLNLEAKSFGTLFNGFTNTKHADIKAITYRDNGVEEFRFDEEMYSLENGILADPIRMMKLTGWK